MRKGVRTAVYDDELHIEAYRFEGIIQPFPKHFHEYYVIGYMEDGERVLSCKNQEYAIKKGDVLVFGPGDSHACVQSGGTLDYRGFNIPRKVMLDLTEEALLLLISLLRQCGEPFEHGIPECRDKIERVCAFMEQHYAERIYPDQLCLCAGLSKSALLR